MSDADEPIASDTVFHETPGSDVYRIAWSGATLSLLSSVQGLRRNQMLCDCKLVAGGQIFLAHKVVLGAASSLLKNLLQGDSSEQATIILVGIGADDLAALLEFIYQGYVKINSNQIPSLLVTAQSLGITSLASYNIKKDQQLIELKNVQISALNMDEEPQKVVEERKIAFMEGQEPLKENQNGIVLSTSRKRSNGNPTHDKIVAAKRNICRSESPAICPYCHIIIKQGRNMTRHLSLKHNVHVTSKKSQSPPQEI